MTDRRHDQTRGPWTVALHHPACQAGREVILLARMGTLTHQQALHAWRMDMHNGGNTSPLRAACPALQVWLDRSGRDLVCGPDINACLCMLCAHKSHRNPAVHRAIMCPAPGGMQTC